MVNIYAVFDDVQTQHNKCAAYLKEHPHQFCYDWVIDGLNYCPIENKE